MAHKKILTNEQLIRAFIKDLHTIEVAFLRERLVKISEITRQSIEENRNSYNSPFATANHWLLFLDKIDKHLGFEEVKQDNRP